MALKKKLEKAEWEKLSKELQKEYTADGDVYLLDTEDDDDDNDDPENDPAALRRARDREKADAKAAKKEAKDLKAKLDALEKERDPKDKDIAKLESEWKDKLEKAEAATAEIKERSRSRIAEQMINNAANEMAGAISTKPKWLARDIKDRLTVEFDDDDDEPTLIVKNAKGKNSDMTLEQLKKEIVANKDYADILIGSKASGGSAPRKATEPKLGSAGASGDKPATLAQQSNKELVASLKAIKEAEA